MFAIIRTGGKQYKVEPNDVLFVERIQAPVGETISLDTVLMVGQGDKTVVGRPSLQGAVVKATVLEQSRADKVIVFKKTRRHTYRRKNGHRQEQTVLRITEIQGPEGLSAKAEPKKVAAPKKEVAPKKAEKPEGKEEKKTTSKPKATKK